ncbi:hypothetical protein PHSC3_002051 [Chlamydiales bacterium STE3]|nr:hypothetical protein PHSC3_002051 [Chlamydiales bacterium STE3]
MSNSFDQKNKDLISLSLHLAPFARSEFESSFYKDVSRRVFFYRNTFLFFGIIFLCLTEILFFHSPNWHFKLIFGYSSSFKLLLCLISGSLSLVALWMGCSLRAGIEAIHENARKTKRKLKRRYLSSSLSPIEKQKYLFSKEEVDILTRQTLLKYEEIEKNSSNEKDKRAALFQIIENQKKQLITLTEN